ncbi:MAG: DUF1566 domain-containing protein [Desulfobacterales bacterium]|nr:DUF1566 domain-containing protein [Desulfobacterales bacterium]
MMKPSRVIQSLVLAIMFITTVSYSHAADYRKFIHKKHRTDESYFGRMMKQWKSPFRASYAIIIAVGDYEYFPRLEAVQRDAGKMKEFLLNTGEYDEVVVLQDEDATFSAIRYFMHVYFPQKMKKGRNRFLFYFSGHGTQHKGYGDSIFGSLLLKGATGEIGDINAVDMDTVETWSKRLRFANHMLFLLDCCFSGLAGTEVKNYDTRVDAKELAKESGRFLITAGGADEKSIADLKRWGGSLFTDVLVSGMKGNADTNDDGVVTTYELFSFVQAGVRNEARRARHKQVPLINQLGIPYKDKGQFFFVYKKPGLPSVKQDIPSASIKEKGNGKKPVAVSVVRLRGKPKTLSEDNVKAMLKKHSFYDSDWNKSGDFSNDPTDNGDGTVTDRTTGLIWQKSGSDRVMTFKEAGDYIDGLNSRKYASYKDWRLPTLEELASLLENKKVKERYIDPVFECKGYWYWSSDKMASGRAWLVYFLNGLVYWGSVDSNVYVRAVRLQTN